MRASPRRAAAGVLARRAQRRPPDAAALMSALPVPVVLLDAREPVPLRQPRRRAVPRHVRGAARRSCALTDLVPADNPLFLLIDQVRRGEVTVVRPRPDAGKPAPAQARHHRAGHAAAGGAGGGAAGDAGRLGGARARPAADLPQRRAQRHRHGGDPGARGEEPAVGHPRRRAVAGGQRRRRRPRTDRADPRRGRPHPRAGRPHGDVRREADRARRR